MAVTPILGMTGAGEFTDDARPGSWNEKIMELFPNGSVSLTAITGMFETSSINETRRDWKTREMSTQSGAVSNIYIDSSLSTAYVYASHQATYGINGAVVYAKVALNTAKQFREGHQVKLRDSDRVAVDVQGKVIDIKHNGASSYLSIRLHEADDNDSESATYNLSTVDRAMVIGNLNMQAGPRPRAIAYDPVDVYNRTQIFRTPLEIAGSTINVGLRGRDAYMDKKTGALFYHALEQEKALIWGIRTENTGANGKEENTMMGIIEFIETYASANVGNFKLDANYSGKTWLESGKTWLDNMMKTIFSKGDGDLGGTSMMYVGGGAALGIQQVVENNTMYTISSETIEYGIKIQRLTSIFGDLLLKIHPLFSWETTNDYSALIVPPKKAKRMPLAGRENMFKPDVQYEQGGNTGIDGKAEEYLAEFTYEYDLTGAWGYLNGVGEDNVV